MGSGGAETPENEDNSTFPGLLPLIQEYLRNIDVDADTMCTLSRYFKVQILLNKGLSSAGVRSKNTVLII